MGLSQYDEFFPFIASAGFAIGDTTTAKALTAAQDLSVRMDVILVVSTSVAAHVITLYLTKGATTVTIGSYSIPAGSGFNGVAGVDLIAQLIPANMGAIVLSPGYFLQAALTVTLGVGEGITMLGLGGLV